MKPTEPHHFIGKAGIIARAMFNRIPTLPQQQDPLERCYLLTGPAGTGKTSLAVAFSEALAGHVWGVEQVNGQSTTVDVVRKWQEDCHYHPLYGTCRVKLIDEIDAASLAACNELRTFLDKLPPRNVVVATTNKSIDELQEQLQSRFKVHYFTPVPGAELGRWLAQHFAPIGADFIASIVERSAGNVRAAKADALNRLEVLQAMAAV